jgi:hypothetical protein
LATVSLSLTILHSQCFLSYLFITVIKNVVLL